RRRMRTRPPRVRWRQSDISCLRLEQPGHRGRAPRPIFGLDLELFPTGARELVELRASRILRLTPLAVEPARPLEALQRGEQRSGIHLEDAARYLLDPPRDSKAVHRL